MGRPTPESNEETNPNLESGAPIRVNRVITEDSIDLDVNVLPARSDSDRYEDLHPFDKFAKDALGDSPQALTMFSLERSPFVSIDQVVELLQDSPEIPEQLSKKVEFLKRHDIHPLFIRTEVIDEKQGKKRKSQRLVCATRAEDAETGNVKNPMTFAVNFDDSIRMMLDHAQIEARKIECLLLDNETFEHLRSLEQNPSERLKYLERLPEEARADQALEQFFRTAVTSGASDVHIEPSGTGDYQVRMRVNGVLQKRYTIPFETARPLIAQLKIRGDMKVDEKRRPLDGQFSLYHKSTDGPEPDEVLKGFSARCSIVPTVDGEKAVLRLLQSRDTSKHDLETLGYKPEILSAIQRLTQTPNGIILVTGPTGSGKTTALYSALEELNDGSTNIVTVEDPVEVPLIGIAQVQVDKAVDRTFGNVLRAFLRQDPDIILVGEVRDEDTAEVAVQAALTGHQVFATVHTNDSFGTIARLRMLGIDNSKLQDTLRGVLSQRLVRSLCGDCKEEYNAADDLNKLMDSPDQEVPTFTEPVILQRSTGKSKHGTACGCCQGTGFTGRFPIAEVWFPGPVEKDLIMRGDARSEEIYTAATKNGMKTMMQWALEDVRDGRTSLAEAIKEVFSAEDLRIRRDDVTRILKEAQ